MSPRLVPCRLRLRLMTIRFPRRTQGRVVRYIMGRGSWDESWVDEPNLGALRS